MSIRVGRRFPGKVGGLTPPASFVQPLRVAAIVVLGVLACRTAAADLLADPRFEAGARFRLQQFVRRGADAKEAEAIFRRLTDLEPQRWVDEWTRLALPWERLAAERDAQGQSADAAAAYRKAYLYYSIAKFPVINHPAKQAAYRKCIEMFLKASRALDPPLERVVIPFDGKQIIAYLRIPKGIERPPVVIATGGVDVYKEDRDVSDLLGAGFAAFSMDMPGAGECPVWYTSDGDRLYSAVIDYLLTRRDLDGTRLGIIGRSYGGYWGARMAFVEPARIKAAVAWGGPIHYTFQEPWLRQLEQEKTYLWPLRDSMIYASHLRDFENLLAFAPTLSLRTQGWLEKKSAPILTLNGAKDPWISIQDVQILLETGAPKTVRIYPDGLHMGGDSGTGPAVMAWLKDRLSR